VHPASTQVNVRPAPSTYQDGAQGSARQLGRSFLAPLLARPQGRGMCTACTRHVHCMHAACALHARGMCTACTRHVHCMHTACALHAACMPPRPKLAHCSRALPQSPPPHGPSQRVALSTLHSSACCTPSACYTPFACYTPLACCTPLACYIPFARHTYSAALLALLGAPAGGAGPCAALTARGR